MIDLKILESFGITAGNLRTWLGGNPLTWKATLASGSTDTQIQMRMQMWNRIRSRIMESMARNFTEYRVYHALDKAWDTSFRQISNTLLSDFIEKDPNSDDVYKQLGEWGLTHLITQEVDKRTGKETGKKTFNLPMFFDVFVPLVKAYVTIRWAKIMNDLDQDPFFDFVYAKLTTPNKLKCGAITDRVQVMSNQYNYYEVVKQAVLKMLHYGWCFQFPKESWHSEEQMKFADKIDVDLKRKNEDGEACALGDKIRIVSREGLRYHHPHPSRAGGDLNHGKYTYNSDSGAEYGLYWQIRRYRDVINSNFWNKEQISIGPNSLVEDHRTFFATVYSACTLQIPILPTTPKNDGNTLLAQVGAGIGELDREKAISYLYYGTDHLDQGVLLTEYFEKLIPNQNGLGDYDCPVWFRFVVAGDNSTFMYAEPLPYCPITYYGYDADESRTLNASLSLEVLPFQDQFGNVLSQILLSAKQNLANLVLIDEDQIPVGSIEKIANLGERFFRSLNIFGFSGKKAVRQQNRIQDSVQSHTFPKANIAELMSVLKTILDVLERVLVMSSHEVAQAASHEQTREEVKTIAQSTSTRLQFTAKPVAIARDSMKRQIYAGLMAFGDPFFYSHIPSDLPLTPEVLKQMGFTYANPEHHSDTDRHRQVVVELKQTAIDLWSLASTRDGQDRPSDAAMAQVMSQMAIQLLSNPVTAPAIGAHQAIMIANQIAQLSGLPRDFKLMDMSGGAAGGDGAPDQQGQAQAQLQQLSQAVLAQVGQEIQPLLEITKKNQSDIAALARVLNVQMPPNPAEEQNGNTPQGPAPNGAPAEALAGVG